MKNRSFAGPRVNETTIEALRVNHKKICELFEQYLRLDDQPEVDIDLTHRGKGASIPLVNPRDVAVKSWGEGAGIEHKPDCTHCRMRFPALHGAHRPRGEGLQQD